MNSKYVNIVNSSIILGENINNVLFDYVKLTVTTNNILQLKGSTDSSTCIVKGVSNPVDINDAANKYYVDNLINSSSQTTAVTRILGDNSSYIATTAFVKNATNSFTTVSFLEGVTSNIQTQLNSKAASGSLPTLVNYGTHMHAVAAGLSPGTLYMSMGNVKSVLPDLIYTFPGGSLITQYFNLANSANGKAWGLVQPLFPLATANITGGFSISFTATQTNPSANDSYFFIGPDNQNINVGVLAVQMNGSSMYIYGYDKGADATKYLVISQSSQGTATWLFSFNPANGFATIWRNGVQIGNGFCSFTGTNITRSTITLGGTSIGNYGPFTGSITNVRIWNSVKTYSPDMFTSGLVE